jgi:two-component sensor histidine kinase
MPHKLVENDAFTRLLSRLPAFRERSGPAGAREVAAHVVATVAIAVIATALRFFLDPYLPAGFPYLTFFPAVILTGFVFGMRAALLSVVLCGLAAWYWFIPPHSSFQLTYQSGVALAFYVVVVGIDLSILQLALLAYRSQTRARAAVQQMLALQETVSEEVDHRMKNMLATVGGLISMSRRHAQTPEELASKLQSRIAAMGEAVRVLRTSLSGGSGDMASTLRSGLMPLGLLEGDRLELSGPRLALNSSAIVALNLIVHELATNAIKYGALSNDHGRVQVSWRESDEDSSPRTVEIVWCERGGPAPQAPSRQGFGSDLITRMSASMNGQGGYEFGPDGVVCRLVLERDLLVQS